MIKNMKMKTALTIVISFFSILCLSFLYVTTQSGMTRLMKTSAKEKMKTSLNSQAALVDEYVAHQEDLLKKYSISPEVVDYLKDLNNVSKKEKAQAFTEKYYAGLDNWEGLYVAADNNKIMRFIKSQYLADLCIKILHIITVTLLSKAAKIV